MTCWNNCIDCLTFLFFPPSFVFGCSRYSFHSFNFSAPFLLCCICSTTVSVVAGNLVFFFQPNFTSYNLRSKHFGKLATIPWLVYFVLNVVQVVNCVRWYRCKFSTSADADCHTSGICRALVFFCYCSCNSLFWCRVRFSGATIWRVPHTAEAGW